MTKKSLKEKLSSAGRIARKTIRKSLVTGAILGSVAGLFNIGAKWVYLVPENFGAVITEADGERVAVTDRGWHMRIPFLSTYENDREPYALANQGVYFHGTPELSSITSKDRRVLHGAVEGLTKDRRAVLASALTLYSINNLDQYAIENVTHKERSDPLGRATFSDTPKDKIQRTLDSIIEGYMQGAEPERILHDREAVEKEIFIKIRESSVEEMYGIKVNDFRLINTSLVEGVINANARRQALIETTAGERTAAVDRKEAVKTLADADAEAYKKLYKVFNPQTPEERLKVMEIFKERLKYNTIEKRPGDTVWLLNGNDPLPTFRP